MPAESWIHRFPPARVNGPEPVAYAQFLTGQDLVNAPASSEQNGLSAE